MAITVQTILAKRMENAQTTQYTSTACKTRIDKFTLTNTTASNVIVNINLVPSAGSASDSNLVISDKTIAPNETYKCPELIGQSLESGGFISTICDTATACTLSGSVIQIT